MVSKGELYRYRADWKEGLFDEFRGGEWHPCTLTFSDASLASIYSAKGARMRVNRWMVHTGVTGFVVVEETRGGRLHAHGVITGSTSRLVKALAVWQQDCGHVHRTEGTDLLGWLQYMLKAFGPESEYVYKKEGRLWLGDDVHSVEASAEATAVATAGDDVHTVAIVSTAGSGVATATVGDTGVEHLQQPRIFQHRLAPWEDQAEA